MEDLKLEIKKGEKLFKEGDRTQDLYIIQKGSVKIYKEVEGQLLPLGIAKEGQFIGELAFFDGKPRSATAEAITDIQVLKFEKSQLEKELAKLPGWLITLINSIAYRVREADELVKRNKIIDKKVSKEFEMIKEEKNTPKDEKNPKQTKS